MSASEGPPLLLQARSCLLASPMSTPPARKPPQTACRRSEAGREARDSRKSALHASHLSIPCWAQKM